MSGKARHGESYPAEYRAWQTARLRCTEPENAAWGDYGGRGITMCDRWLNDVGAFVSDMGRKPSEAHELDREDNSKGYEPDNCRWVLRPVQSRNRRSNHLVSARGETLTIAEWAERSGVAHSTITKRLAAGWASDLAIFSPARGKEKNGKAKLRTHACACCGKYGVVGKRCHRCENGRRAACAAITTLNPELTQEGH